jgi:hypothetical protein
MYVSCTLCPELLKRSRENKERHDKERLQAYYKKNFKAWMDALPID